MSEMTLERVRQIVQDRSKGTCMDIPMANALVFVLQQLEASQRREAAMRVALELARHKFIKSHAKTLDELKTMPTPYDKALSPNAGADYVSKSEG